MSIIELSKPVRCDKNKAYSLLKDIANFPKFMNNVRSIRILERHTNRMISSWEIKLDGVEIIWREEDFFDDDNFKVDFKMLEGDYNRYTGSWIVKEDKIGSRIILKVDIEWGAPGLVEFINHILEKKTKSALKSMLLAIKKKLEEEE